MPIIIFSLISLLLPTALLNAATLGELVGKVTGVINIAIPVVSGLILLAFFWGIARYVFSGGDAMEKGRGKEIILWGLIAIFVTFSMWGIVMVLQNVFIRF